MTLPPKGTPLVAGGKTKEGKTIWVPAPAGTKFYQKTVSGGVRVYNPATKQYETRATPPTAAEAKAMAAEEQKQLEAGKVSERVTAEEKEIAALKATTTQKEKDVMTLQIMLDYGKLSKGAEEKFRASQQELMKDLPEKNVKTVIEIGGKPFIVDYGLKRVYGEPVIEKTPAIATEKYLSFVGKRKEGRPLAPARQKETKETVDVTYSLAPLSSLFVKNVGTVTEVKPTIYNVSKSPLIQSLMPDYEKKFPEMIRWLETKEIEATRKGDKGLADIYGFGSAVLYPFRTPESTLSLVSTFGKGAAFGYGITALGMATGPVIPAAILYGSSIYGATQVPKLQEQIAAAQFLGPVAYREKLSETGAHAAAAIGGAYAGSKLVPFTISVYKGWHDQWISSKLTYGETTALKRWEKTLAHSEFISVEQKQVILERTGAKPASYKYEYFLDTKPASFDKTFKIPTEPIQLRQAQIYLPETKIIYKPKVEPTIRFVESQYLGKWLPTPADSGYYRFKLNQLRMDTIMLKGGFKGYGATQYELGTVDVDTFGKSFFESSYFKTGIYAKEPTLLLEYKPVGAFESFMQRITSIEYTPPKVFVGKKASGQIFDFSTFDEEVFNPFRNLREQSKLGKGGAKSLTKVLYKVPEEPSVYDWEFYPASMGGIFGIGKVEDKSIVGLKLFQEQKLSQEQKQKLEQEQKLGQVSLLGLKEISLIKQEQRLEQVSLTRQGLGQPTGQRQTTGQITEQIAVPKLVVPTVTVPELKIPELKLKIDIEPEPEIGFGAFGFGGFRFPSLGKEKFGFLIPRGSRLKRREVTVEPFAGLYDVHVSEFMFGRATHPARTKKEKAKFKRRIRESAQLFPTVELEKAFRKKIKL